MGVTQKHKRFVHTCDMYTAFMPAGGSQNTRRVRALTFLSSLEKVETTIQVSNLYLQTIAPAGKVQRKKKLQEILFP